VNDDLRWMDYALRLGRRALGTTAENPAVGCVIVKDGRVLGVGCTAPGGRPHAETEALAMAGDDARGATAYVTLEPCAHHGRTPPCAEALMRSGIARVVAAVEDPDPRTSGAGHQILRAAGIKVDVGSLAEEARRDLAGFLTRITRKRPYVILKLALSSDAMIAAGPGQRTRITGPEAKARVHLWRAQSDAILTGRKTVEIDKPELTCRLPGLEDRSPRRFVLSSRETPIVADMEVLVIDPANGSSLVHAVGGLAERGINRLLVEGGAKVAQTFLAADLVDDVRLLQSPDELGRQGVSAGISLDKGFNLVAIEKLGRDTLTVYERVH
jgi:diaminohydroxyphosphoribosylaminopyrimidine deaminase / 5-amino-6-(5-phosphoribosylamino)uracil reductase